MNLNISQELDANENLVSSIPLSPTSSLSSSPASITSPFQPRRHNSVGYSTNQTNVPKHNFTKLSQSFSIPIQSSSNDTNLNKGYVSFYDQELFNRSASLRDRNSWKESLTELSEKLQEICGSSTISQSCQSLSSSPLNSLKKKFESNDQYFNFSSADNLDQKTNKNDIYQGNFLNSCPATPLDLNIKFSPPKQFPKVTGGNTHVSGKKLLKRAESAIDSPHFEKQIVVRHIETQNKLNSQLAQITGLNNIKGNKSNLKQRFSLDFQRNNISTATIIQEETHDHTNFLNLSIRNQQIKVSHKIDVEDLVVKIDNEKKKICLESALMNILHVDSKEKNKINEFTLESDRPECCLCLINKNGTLTISQQSKSEVHVENTNSSNIFYLPVVKGDESTNGEYVISIHIPSCFQTNDISVQTVDDKLFVIGKRVFKTKDNHSKKDPHQIHQLVFIKLPPSVDSRSVSSYFTKNNQLLIKTLGFV